jgi:hypothetical protein
MELSDQLHAPAALFPLDRRLDGSRTRSGRYGEEKISCLYQESNPIYIEQLF